MGAQRLGAKRVRRIEEATGHMIAFAVAYGGVVFEFVTIDHRHGEWHSKTGEWGWTPDSNCFVSCRERHLGPRLR